MKGGRLPNGTSTESDEEYVEEWRTFARPILEIVNASLYAFDPGIRISTNECYPMSLDLPEWFIRCINNELAALRQRAEEAERRAVPRDYLYVCQECGHEEMRYRNSSRCRKCGGLIVRKLHPVPHLSRDDDLTALRQRAEEAEARLQAIGDEVRANCPECKGDEAQCLDADCPGYRVLCILGWHSAAVLAASGQEDNQCLK